MNFQLTSTSGLGNFEITDEQGAKVVALTYENWFSSKASAQESGREITIKPRNIWYSNFDLFVDNVDRGDITFNWKGHIIIKLINEQGTERTFLLQSKGFWNQHFELEDAQGQTLLQLMPTFKWQKMQYNYEIHLEQNTFTPFELTVLLLACGYGLNLYMMVIAAAV